MEWCCVFYFDMIWVCDFVMGDMILDGEFRVYVFDEIVLLMMDVV